MRTRICETFGIEFPIFAFSHCRDVVAAVSRAGGMGVLGPRAFSPEQREIELTWIDERVDGTPYGVDVVMPASLAGSDVDKLEAMIPEAHRRWVEEVLEQHNVPPLPEDEPKPEGLLAWTHDKAKRQVEIALTHPIKLIANALATPPSEVIDQAHAPGVQVAALVGNARHARADVAAGGDVIVGQGAEAGGHTREMARIVRIAEMVDGGRPTPGLAAGVIGSWGLWVAAVRLWAVV